MLAFSQPVKFLGTEVKTGNSKTTGNPYTIVEAKLFVPDLGRVRVMVNAPIDEYGKPQLPPMPEEESLVNLALSIDQGRHQSLQVVWDKQTQFRAASK